MPLADFIFTRTQQRVLAAIFLKPEAWSSFSDIARAARSHGASQNYLKRLTKAGVLEDRFAGNQHQYRANRDFPLFAELRSICLKSFGLADRLRTALLPFGDRVERAFIFGSFAKQTDLASSDIDLFVVGDLDLFELNAALDSAERDLGRPIQSNLYTAEDYARNSSDSVVKAIMDGPRIPVIDRVSAPDRNGESASARRREAGGSKPRRRRAVSKER